MADPYLSEIKLFAFGFAPRNWALCAGQLLPINQNQALFSLLGTTYGGNGQTTFGLPNLQGNVPIHEGNGHTLGEKAGTTAVTISQQTMAQHLHFMNVTNNDGTAPNPGAAVILSKSIANSYGGASSLVAMNPASTGPVGGSQAHNNMMPYLVLNFCIALQGIFPSQN